MLLHVSYPFEWLNMSIFVVKLAYIDKEPTNTAIYLIYTTNRSLTQITEVEEIVSFYQSMWPRPCMPRPTESQHLARKINDNQHKICFLHWLQHQTNVWSSFANTCLNDNRAGEDPGGKCYVDWFDDLPGRKRDLEFMNSVT